MMFPVVRISSLALALGALVPGAAYAQAAPSEPLAPAAPWHFAASIYGYLPSIGGTSRFPVDSGGTPINITAEDILKRLKFVAMGSFEAQNGTWGVFTDLVYLHFGDSKTNSRDFTIDDIGLPGGTTANLDWSLKGTVWTTAAEYRVVTDPSLTLDLLGGARLFNLRETLDYSIDGSIGPSIRRHARAARPSRRGSGTESSASRAATCSVTPVSGPFPSISTAAPAAERARSRSQPVSATRSSGASSTPCGATSAITPPEIRPSPA
jgi:hypothetical protein